MTEPVPGRAGQAVIADADRVVLTEALPTPPARTTVRLSGLPYLLPLLQLGSAAAPYAVAVVDDHGADLHAVDDEGRRIHRTTEGTRHPARKPHGDQPAHRSAHSRVEETIRRTIDDTAGETKRLADAAAADLIVVAGDISARTALSGALISHNRHVVQLEGLTRRNRHDRVAVDRRVHEVLDDRVRARSDIAGRFEQARAHGLAVQGLGDTAAALTERNVEALLIDPAAVGERTVYIGSDPARVQRTRLPSDGGTRCRADEALPLAALAVDAGIVTTDRQLRLTDGVGGLLRHR